MKSANIRAMLMVSLILVTAGCGKSQPQSKVWFDGHPHDAALVIRSCREGSVRGDECRNADASLQEAQGRKQFKAFLGQ